MNAEIFVLPALVFSIGCGNTTRVAQSSGSSATPALRELPGPPLWSIEDSELREEALSEWCACLADDACAPADDASQGRPSWIARDAWDLQWGTGEIRFRVGVSKGGGLGVGGNYDEAATLASTRCGVDSNPLTGQIVDSSGEVVCRYSRTGRGLGHTVASFQDFEDPAWYVLSTVCISGFDRRYDAYRKRRNALIQVLKLEWPGFVADYRGLLSESFPEGVERDRAMTRDLNDDFFSFFANCRLRVAESSPQRQSTAVAESIRALDARLRQTLATDATPY